MKINPLDILINLCLIAAIFLIVCIAFFLLALLDIATGWCITKITHLPLSVSSVIVALHIIAAALFLNSMATKSLAQISTRPVIDDSDLAIFRQKKRKPPRHKK